MGKISLKKADPKKLGEFFSRTDIGSPQTYEIENGQLRSRAYPKSKAFIKADTIDLNSIWGNQDKSRLTLPMVTISKMISALSLFKEEVDIEFSTSNSIVEKTKLTSGKSSIIVPSGDLGLVLPPLPDDIWDKMTTTAGYAVSFKLTSEDIAKMYKMNVVETGTSSKTIVRYGGVKLFGDGVVFSSPDNESNSDEMWSHTIENAHIDGKLDGQWLFNLKSINKFDAGDGTAYIKTSPNNEKVMIMIIESESGSKMVIVLNKNE